MDSCLVRIGEICMGLWIASYTVDQPYIYTTAFLDIVCLTKNHNIIYYIKIHCLFYSFSTFLFIVFVFCLVGAMSSFECMDATCHNPYTCTCQRIRTLEELMVEFAVSQRTNGLEPFVGPKKCVCRHKRSN